MTRSLVLRTALLVALAAASAPAAGQAPPRESREPAASAPRIRLAVDSIVGTALGRIAGISVAVVRGADTLAIGAHGYADLEHSVPTPHDAIYEIGSVTKQFTAAAILQLAERGALSLDDDITRFFPDFPTGGRSITIRRLLDHTSGIRGYTEMPEFDAIAPRELPRDSLIALIAAAPPIFAPGDAMIYNNSAYFLLGLIVEQASGVGYADYVERYLFAPAGMTRSSYCSNTEVVRNRAHGYSSVLGEFSIPDYIHHTWTLGAISLCSTVRDLVAWNAALHAGKILSPAAYRELITPGTLQDGTQLRYGDGLRVDSIFGRLMLWHGGSIPGYSSALMYFPEDSLTIVVLMNTLGLLSATAVGQSIAEAIYGGWEPPAVPFAREPGDYTGEYLGVGRTGERLVMIRTGASGELLFDAADGEASPMLFLGGETFGVALSRYTFLREEGRVVGLRVDEFGENVVLRKQR